MQEKIQLATIKLDNLTVSANQMAEFFDIVMTQYDRYITYCALGALGLMMICVLLFCYKLQNTLYKIAAIIDNDNENLKELIIETGGDLQEVLNIYPPIQGPSNQGPGNGNILRQTNHSGRSKLQG